MATAPPRTSTTGELRAAGYRSRGVRQELRENLLARLSTGTPIFEGVLGYEDTVVPAVENALLCGHDLIFLGERGQAKTRMIRKLATLLDEWLPVVSGSEIHDDPFAPVSALARARLRDHLGPSRRPLRREARHARRLDRGSDRRRRPRQGGRGSFPRRRTEKVQVGLFNIMEERDVQVKGYRVRLPIDVMIVASANPEDYTSRGRIITPLKDRYAAQIRTHYPPTPDLELAIVHQEARLPELPGILVWVPPFMERIVAELTFQARHSPDVNQASGVSVRMSIANYETLVANAVRRALRAGEKEAVPRVSDLECLLASTCGKIELEYAGADRDESAVIRDLTRRATKLVFDEECSLDALAPVVAAFDEGWNVEVSSSMPSAEYLAGLDQIPGLREAALRISGSEAPARVAAAVEFLLEGLHLSNKLNKSARERGARYARA
jgi:magnesium chelatase subunit I